MKKDSEIIKDLCSTQHHDDKWPRILDRLYPICNADYAGLAVFDKHPDPQIPLFQSFTTTSTNIDPDTKSEYMENYAHHELGHIQRAMESSVGTMVLDPDFDDYEKIIQRADVVFAMEKMNFFHRSRIRLNNEQTHCDVITMQLRADRLENFTEEEIDPLLPYVPHLAQAISMGRFYDAIRQRYQAVLSMLDRVNVGMVLLSSDGSVVVANTYAQEIIEGSKRLKINKRGFLKITDSIMNIYFVSRIEALRSSENSAEKYIIRLGHDEDSSDLMLELSPVFDSDADINSGFLGVMVIIVDPNRPFLASHESMSTLFSLTKAESAVAQLIANGSNYNDAAEMRGVSRETIKTQAGKLMQKMNVKTRAGVIRKLMTLGLPFNDSTS